MSLWRRGNGVGSEGDVRLILLIVLIASFPSQPLSQEAQENVTILDEDTRLLFASNMQDIAVNIIDQVQDGCWTNPSSSTTSIELELTRSGYSIAEKDSPTLAFIPAVNIGAIGYALSNKNSCAVYANMSVTNLDFDEYPTVTSLPNMDSVFRRKLFSSGSLLTGSKSNMSQRITDIHTDMIKEFLVTISKQKTAIIKQIRNNKKISDSVKESLIQYIKRER